MKLFGNIFYNRKILVTGHTGFKGSWLSLWLKMLGAEVSGIALNPYSQVNHYDLLALDINDVRLDITDEKKVFDSFELIQPEIVFHLAAQPLVRPSYESPLDTWKTNVIGSANILEACRQTKSVKSIVAVTTDKVYKNKEWGWGYREIDRLGGHDPYSASKAANELLIESYRSAFFTADDQPLLASVRAGNVIGGGDWSRDRLIPDLVRAVNKKTSLDVRNPQATRPWQHVLDCLAGYLRLGQFLIENRSGVTGAWNFGPDIEGNRTVGELIGLMKEYWQDLSWHQSKGKQPHEANLLYLDSSKARTQLGWKPIWDLDKAARMTAEWYRDHYLIGKIQSISQIEQYIEDAEKEGASWVGEWK